MGPLITLVALCCITLHCLHPFKLDINSPSSCRQMNWKRQIRYNSNHSFSENEKLTYWLVTMLTFTLKKKKNLKEPSPFSSLQFNPSVVSDSLRPHGLQHARFPVHHQLPELTQTHVHGVSDATQPSHPPLLSPSPPAFSFSQHQGLFQWVNFFASGGQSTGVSASVSVLPMNIQDFL